MLWYCVCDPGKHADDRCSLVGRSWTQYETMGLLHQANSAQILAHTTCMHNIYHTIIASCGRETGLHKILVPYWYPFLWLLYVRGNKVGVSLPTTKKERVPIAFRKPTVGSFPIVWGLVGLYPSDNVQHIPHSFWSNITKNMPFSLSLVLYRLLGVGYILRCLGLLWR